MDECDGIYEGETLKKATISPRQSDIPKVLTARLKSVDKHFADVGTGVMDATRIADFSSWPLSADDSAGTCP